MTETPEERARRLGLTQNTDPAQARARRLGLVPNQEPEPSWDERIAAPLRSAYQTATFGLGNKLTAMTRAALPQALGGTEGFDYSGALSDERQKMESFRRRHPYIDAAAGAAGAVAPLILTGGTGTPMALKSLAGAPAAAPTVAGSARAGGAFGAMYGAGEGDNTTVEQTLENAVRGGIAGATLAGGLHAGGTSAAKLMDYAGVRPSGRESGVAGRVANLAGVKSQEERALETVLEKFRRAGMAPRDALAVSNEATRIGKPEMVMDIGGEPTVRLGRGMQGVPSKGAEEMRAALIARREAAPVRAAQEVEAGLGARGRGPFGVQKEIGQRRQAAASPRYQRAFESPDVPLDATVQRKAGDKAPPVMLVELMERPSMQKAQQYGQQLAAEEGRAMPALDPTNPAVPLRELHNLKLRLDEMLGYAKNNGKLPDGTPATKQMLRQIEQTKNQLLDIMDSRSPDYRQGRKIWAGESEMMDGFELGREFAGSSRTSVGEMRDRMGKLSQAAQENVRLGVVSELRNVIDNTTDGHDVVMRVFGNEAKRQRLRAAFPDDASFTRFEAQMKSEARMRRNENTNLGNSQTAEKLADQGDFYGTIPGNIPTSVGGVVSRGVNAVVQSRAGDMIRRRAVQRADALSPLLKESTPQGRGRVIQSLEEVLQRQLQRAPGRTAMQRAAGGRVGGYLSESSQ